MKPFIAGVGHGVGPRHARHGDPDRPGSITITGATITDAHPHGALTVAQVIQKRATSAPSRWRCRCSRARCGSCSARSASASARRSSFRRGGHRAPAPVQELAADRAGDDELRLRPVGEPVPARARYTVFAHDGELVPVSIVHRLARPPRRCRACRRCRRRRRRAVREMFLHGDAGRRHRAQRR